MIRILRLMEYVYPDNETADDDMSRWHVPPIGLRIVSEDRLVRSTVLVNLNFEADDDENS